MNTAPEVTGLVDEYGDRLRRICYLLLHSSPAAEDVVQETFAQALARADQFRGDGEIASWLMSIALNLCRRALRDEQRHAELAEPRKLEGGRRLRFSPRGILTSLVRRETARNLAIALGYLTDAQREAFVLHYVEELPYEEIGRLVNATPGAARALAFRAREVLRGKLAWLDATTRVK